MDNKIRLFGVSTNNLKSIDVAFTPYSITSVTGISGGGKSSLVYDSLYEKCRQEFNSIENGYYDNANYKIRTSKNIIPAVALKQKNNNINPRSTIYSYLNFPSLISSLIFERGISVDIERLKLNKPENQCEHCEGLGEIFIASNEKIIDHNTKVNDNPFRPWKSSTSNKNHKLLIAFCLEKGIPLEKRFCELSVSHRRKLTEHKGSELFEISFKHSGKSRKRKLAYFGVTEEIKEALRHGSESAKKLALKFCERITCPHCDGSRINTDRYSDMHIYGLSFDQFINSPIDSVLNELQKSDSYPEHMYQMLHDIRQNGLGYLSLSRSIPSLSGGELQKLNFAKLNSSEVTGLLVVIDEISSQVHASDYKILIDGITSIKERGNTVILVEHNELFVKNSNYVIEIGPKSGSEGGYLLEHFPPSQDDLYFSTEKIVPDEFFTIDNVSKNNVKSLSISFPQHAISILVGKSGSGKSSIAKYIHENIEDTIYVSQELIKGNIRSTVATLTGANKKISKLFSKYFDKEEAYFSISDFSPLVCRDCQGKGVIRLSRSFEQDIEITCPSCEGKLFGPESNNYKTNNLSIRDIYNLTFDEISLLGLDWLEPISASAIKLGLGHLSLNRKSQTLSGGELKRIKILINLPIRNRSKKILVIDEPGSGLDDKTTANVMRFIASFRQNYKSIIIIDHKPSVFMSADHVIEIGPGSAANGGRIIFTGSAKEYYDEKYLGYISALI